MKVFVTVKQAGKRKEYITKKELDLKGAPLSLRELIIQVVGKNVHDYNSKTEEPLIMKYLSKEDMENQVKSGKVGFGERKNDRLVDVKKASDTAILAFEDGIYRVFINDNEVSSLDEQLLVNEGDVLTFIRFTMLAGRMW